MRRRTLQSFLAVGALVAGITSSAQAGLSIVGSVVGGSPGTAAGTMYENFNRKADGTPPSGASSFVTFQTGINVSFTDGNEPGTGKAVTGGVSGQFAAPFVSGSNGTFFGNTLMTPQPDGVDETVYLTSGVTSNPGGSVTLDFGTGQRYVGLLWGSVDTYNTLTFYDGNNLVGTLTGTQVFANANGDQGANGTRYVNINSSDAFTRVVATSSSYAFEFDNVAFNDQILTPEPATALMGLIAVGFVGMRRRMKKATSAV